jgi:hypothetical protein
VEDILIRLAKRKAKPKKSRAQRQQEPEGEGGPFERERAFLEERFSTLIPKEEGEVRDRVKSKDTFTPSRDEFISAKRSIPLSENFRLNLVKDYRERQSRQQTEKNVETSLSSPSIHKEDQPSPDMKKKTLMNHQRDLNHLYLRQPITGFQ